VSGRGLTIHVNQLPATGDLTAAEVRRAVQLTAEMENLDAGEISVTFVGAEAITALNETHLQRSRPTDVIAFNLGEPAEPLGDVYICPEVAARSAAELGIDVREELLRLVIHGVLHVAGRAHPNGPERLESEMFRRQEAILERVL